MIGTGLRVGLISGALPVPAFASWGFGIWEGFAAIRQAKTCPTFEPSNMVRRCLFQKLKIETQAAG
jgi:hypothetical protein